MWCTPTYHYMAISLCNEAIAVTVLYHLRLDMITHICRCAGDIFEGLEDAADVLSVLIQLATGQCIQCRAHTTGRLSTLEL